LFSVSSPSFFCCSKSIISLSVSPRARVCVSRLQQITQETGSAKTIQLQRHCTAALLVVRKNRHLAVFAAHTQPKEWKLGNNNNNNNNNKTGVLLGL
jgi:hypothetical protein